MFQPSWLDKAGMEVVAAERSTNGLESLQPVTSSTENQKGRHIDNRRAVETRLRWLCGRYARDPAVSTVGRNS